VLVYFLGQATFRLNQKEQVHDDMPNFTRAIAVERMLESADPLIEKHRGNLAAGDQLTEVPSLPEGWALYSISYEPGGTQKGWRVELIDAMRPYQTGSIVGASNNESFDAALREASRKIPLSRSSADDSRKARTANPTGLRLVPSRR
jgi:hypothetical protein